MFANAKCSEFRLKCVSRNPELRGGARRTRNATMGLRQRGFDHWMLLSANSFWSERLKVSTNALVKNPIEVQRGDEL
jgi:hypothetical protein